MKLTEAVANALIKLLEERDVELTFDDVKMSYEDGKFDASSDKMKVGMKKGYGDYE